VAQVLSPFELLPSLSDCFGEGVFVSLPLRNFFLPGFLSFCSTSYFDLSFKRWCELPGLWKEMGSPVEAVSVCDPWSEMAQKMSVSLSGGSPLFDAQQVLFSSNCPSCLFKAAGSDFQLPRDDSPSLLH